MVHPRDRALLVSCFFAVLVNISSFLCIGRFSAVSFQVIGHVKTCLVFFFGWVIFAAPITSRNIMGCCLAVVGMIYYSHAVTKQQHDRNSGSGKQPLEQGVIDADERLGKRRKGKGRHQFRRSPRPQSPPPTPVFIDWHIGNLLHISHIHA